MILKDKKVLITGAGRGIGRQTAIDMAKEGAVILGTGRTLEPLKEMEEQIKVLGGRTFIKTMDIANYEETKRGVDALAEMADGIDILINCAGIFEEAFFMEMTPEQWRRTMAIDLDGVYYVTHSTIPYIIEAKGSVVSVVSQDVFYGCPGYSHYSAAKAAVVGLTRTLARELGPKGVRLNCVAPGITETEMTRDRIENGRQVYLEKLPIGHIGQPGEISSTIIFWRQKKQVISQGKCCIQMAACI